MIRDSVIRFGTAANSHMYSICCKWWHRGQSVATFGIYHRWNEWYDIIDFYKMTHLQENESAIEFARRVKHAIAVKSGLVDLEWDGQLKRSKVPARQIAEQQRLYAERFERTASMSSSHSSSSLAAVIRPDELNCKGAVTRSNPIDALNSSRFRIRSDAGLSSPGYHSSKFTSRTSRVS